MFSLSGCVPWVDGRDLVRDQHDNYRWSAEAPELPRGHFVLKPGKEYYAVPDAPTSKAKLSSEDDLLRPPSSSSWVNKGRSVEPETSVWHTMFSSSPEGPPRYHWRAQGLSVQDPPSEVFEDLLSDFDAAGFPVFDVNKPQRQVCVFDAVHRGVSNVRSAVLCFKVIPSGEQRASLIVGVEGRQARPIPRFRMQSLARQLSAARGRSSSWFKRWLKRNNRVAS